MSCQRHLVGKASKNQKYPARKLAARFYVCSLSRVDSLIKSQLRFFYCLLSFTLWPLNYSLHWGRLSQKHDNDDECLSFFSGVRAHETRKMPCKQTLALSTIFIRITTPAQKRTTSFSMRNSREKLCKWNVCGFSSRKQKTSHFDETSPSFFLFNRQNARYVFREICLAKIPMLYADNKRKNEKHFASICKRESY